MLRSPGASSPALPARRPDLRIAARGDGTYVVKDTTSGEHYQVGEEEHYLLTALDGEVTASRVCDAFEGRFGKPLPEEDLLEFVEVARERGLVVPREETAADRWPPPREPRRQSLLYWRKSLWDPDRLFGRIEPWIRFFWTRGFLFASALSIATATLVLWADREQLARSAIAAIRWDTLFWGWPVLFAVSALHECAHGLTCKHYGGEVREIGFLLMYFMPCFYCNVSDAWLFPERRKRLWVTLAGGYFELFLWALAVFAWRLTAADTIVHHLAFLVLAVGGAGSLFNFNPLIKLDGYYLVSDWKEIPNLRRRSLDRVKAHLRRLLWGAPRPGPEAQGRFLTGFGLASWAYSATFLVLMLAGLWVWFGGMAGPVGHAAAAGLALPALLGISKGVFAGEVSKMITKRRKRALAWLLGLGGAAAALFLVEMEDYSSGSFTVRPSVRRKVRAPVAGFLGALPFGEGDRVEKGDVIARLEVPDLDCLLARKRAELREAEAELRLLEVGARPEEVAEQQRRVERAVRWHAAARKDLDRMRATLEAELAALDERVAEAAVTQDAADREYARVHSLFAANVATREEMEKSDQARRAAQARLSLAKAEKRVREARGTILAEQELVRREKELADERSALALLKAGTRPEEIAAQKARTDSLETEICHIERRLAKLEIRSAVAGVIVTPRLEERAGEYLEEGGLVCVIEEPRSQEAEITLKEDKLQRVEVGQSVRLKVRALPFETFEGRVTGIARSAATEENARTVVVYCAMDHTSPVLRTSMSGHARIYTGRRPLGGVFFGWAVRLLRTEFWW